VDYLNISGGIAVREYERAIRTAILALNLDDNARVALSPLCPEIYLRVFNELKIRPVYIDMDKDTGAISVSLIEKYMENGLDAVIVYYHLGCIPDLETLIEYNLPMIEDISSSIGGSTGVRSCGSYGRYIVMSMEQKDLITTAGGALLLAGSKSELQNLKKITNKIPAGSLLPDLNAALGLIQIDALEKYIETRKEIAKLYNDAVMKTRHKTIVRTEEEGNIHYSFPVFLDGGMKEVIQYAQKNGIEAVPAFQDSILANSEIRDISLPNAESLLLRCVLFPLYPGLGKKNIEQTIKVLSTLP